MSRHPLTTQARITILVVAFLGWFFGGVQIGLTNLGGPATIGLLNESGWSMGLTEEAVEQQIKTWAAYLQVAFLFGAAAGGFFFGRLGDTIGRTRALGISIIWFSIFTALSYYVANPLQLIVVRFVACLGVGGCWPNGVALVGESWSKVARPVMASMIGMAGNVGIFALATLLKYHPPTPDSFRWVFLVGATALPVGVLILLFVRESPAWLSTRETDEGSANNAAAQKLSVFRKPYLGVTLVGIALATVPLFGGWGSFLWIVFWAGRIGDELGLPELKAEIVQMRSLLSIVGCALAAVISARIGRRTCYFLTSFAALIISQYIFWFTTPTDEGFLIWVAFLGFFNGIFFGWLPFFLPELFETKVRATGAGVSFNYGRILTAITISLTPALTLYFNGDYAQIGRVTSLIFIVGMIAILFAPDTSKRHIEAQ
ncbi:MAG: MFS transporter [Verrucomicrobia bacterium]|nr:MFS transporter [Verrucomicrobiota bacterium]